MCGAAAQCGKSMSPNAALRQQDKSHVRHAMIEGVRNIQDGQRCALLTTKSRKACTRATDFNSSG